MLTRILDTLLDNAGQPFSGRLEIQPIWALPNQSGAGASLVPTPISLTITGGALDVSLEPNTTIAPSGSYYNVRYSPSSSRAPRWNETWFVPTSLVTLRVHDVRTTARNFAGIMIQPSQLDAGGATTVGQALVWSGSNWTPGAAVTGAWGTILGTLSDQADLQAALNAKLDAGRTINGHALTADVTLTKADIGLGSVDNTSDASKPISTATAAALAGKVSLSGSYADPAWITSLEWSKIASKPSTYAPSAHAASHSAGGGDQIAVTMAQVTGLGSALTAFAAASHASQHAQDGADAVTVAMGQVTGLSAALAGKVATSRLVSTSGPLSGGGALSADLTLSIAKASASVDGYLAKEDFAAFAAKEPAIATSTSAKVWLGDKTWGDFVASINGVSGAVNFSASTTGTALNWAGATLQIPLASVAGVAAGLISKAEYDTFNGKVSPASLAAVATSGNAADLTGTLAAARLPSVAVQVAGSPSVGQVPVWNGSGWGAAYTDGQAVAGVVAGAANLSTANAVMLVSSAGVAKQASGVSVVSGVLTLAGAGPQLNLSYAGATYIAFTSTGSKTYRVGGNYQTSGDFAIFNATDSRYALWVSPAGNINLGAATDNTYDRLQVNGSAAFGASHVRTTIGGAYTAALGYGSGFLGFKLSNTSAGNWTAYTDGGANGAAMVMGDKDGRIRFYTIPNSGTPGAEQTLTDAQIVALERMRITSSGNLLIGTKADDTTNIFQVAGKMAVRPILYASNQSGGITIGHTASTSWDGGIFIRSNAGGGPRLAFDAPVKGEVISLDYQGYVGIGPGNTAPTGTLHVQDNTATTGATRLYVRKGAADTTSTNTFDTDASIRAEGATFGGKVGIGGAATTSPLEVRGGQINGLNSFNSQFIDTSSIVAGIGGGVGFGGYYTGVTPTLWAGISGLKENATVGEYGGYLSFRTRAHGSSMAESMRLTSAGVLALSINADVGLYRSAAGILEVNIGSAGNLADLKLRDLIVTAAAPASSTATGTAGMFRWDGTYIYICTAANTWKRAALSTF
jgi:hypothetical protein